MQAQVAERLNTDDPEDLKKSDQQLSFVPKASSHISKVHIRPKMRSSLGFTNALVTESNPATVESMKLQENETNQGQDGVEEVGVGVNLSDETATFKSSNVIYRQPTFGDKTENMLNLNLVPNKVATFR